MSRTSDPLGSRLIGGWATNMQPDPPARQGWRKHDGGAIPCRDDLLVDATFRAVEPKMGVRAAEIIWEDGGSDPYNDVRFWREHRHDL